MKKVFKSVIAIAIFSLVFTSCKKEDIVSAPVISELEVGVHHEEGEDHAHDAEEGDHAEAHIGEDMHVEAKIVAEGKIAYIVVEIHNEKTGKDVIDEVKFTEGFVGLKNATFHKHVDIPANTDAGEYHFHLKVVDQLGKSTEVEKELHLEHEVVVPIP